MVGSAGGTDSSRCWKLDESKASGCLSGLHYYHALGGGVSCILRHSMKNLEGWKSAHVVVLQSAEPDGWI